MSRRSSIQQRIGSIFEEDWRTDRGAEGGNREKGADGVSMILKQITLSNFGVYTGVQSLKA